MEPKKSRAKQKQNRRSYNEIRKNLLKTLLKGQKSLNQLARESGINWRTVDNHLTILIGMELVEETLSSPYVRLFKLTEKGRIEAQK